MTVNTALPLNADGHLEYDRLGVGNSLWAALAEKLMPSGTRPATRPGNVNAYYDLTGRRSVNVYDQAINSSGQSQEQKWTSSVTAARCCS